MRPIRKTDVHITGDLAELVCSNSLKSESTDTPTGALKENLAQLDSLIIKLAKQARVPAGKALAVDREKLAASVTEAIETEEDINLIRSEVTEIPVGYDSVIIATGPLTSDDLAATLQNILGDTSLYFYDAIAPIVEADSIDPAIAFVQDRYGEKGIGDYLNLPMSKEEYETFIDALLAAKTVELREFEKKHYFEGCLPIEEIARRGRNSLAFGPLKPVGLFDPATERRPHAVIQLRKENIAGDAYNMVGFQTKLTYPEQERVFRTIPGMKNVNFLRHGSLHRNTYVNSPEVLNSDLSLKAAPNVRLAGQITGVEGYVESITTGLLAGMFAVAEVLGESFEPPPATTTIGALLAYIKDQDRKTGFQPTNINFSLFPPLEEKIKNRKERRRETLHRAKRDFEDWVKPEAFK
ncbi:Methylenetetrahydrofolate--tRNA-(uracil-5-)-methyltransferase TrmFO [hydrothermal vent metagenome]|uniref:Methylenetetrahydrofolate--tRNA-(Uracil-5-)-methyltransferase TrmFO n=1 Tax=hydrothermal vent metagenome TaxID=652676 RepID=A0A3B1CGT4_9ZZZZ